MSRQGTAAGTFSVRFAGRTLPLASALAAAVFAATLSSPAIALAAAYSSVPDSGTWVPNGLVRAITTAPDGTAYIGGDFSYVGPRTGGCVPVSPTGTGRVVESFPQVNGSVQTIKPDGSGGYYIGGRFSSVGGLPRSNIAHIRADLTVDPSWDTTADATVEDIEVIDGLVYVGGWFTSIAGQERHYVAALDASGSATAWDAGVDTDSALYVSAVTATAGTVYFGGYFQSVAGQPRWCMAAADASGALTPWNPHPNAQSYEMVVRGNVIYVLGGFTHVGGVPRGFLAAIDTSGALTPWDPQCNGHPDCMDIYGDTMYVGGYFSSIGGQPRASLAALQFLGESTGAATPWNPAAETSASVYAVERYGDTVYVGTDILDIGGQRRHCLAAFDTAGSLTAWNPVAAGGVQALAASADRVYVGGRFNSIGGVPRYGLASLDASGHATAWDPIPRRSSVWALATKGDVIYVGGYFSSIGGQPRGNIAAVSRSTGLATSWSPETTGVVAALAVATDTVYASGGFQFIGGQERHYIAELDDSGVTTGVATAWDPKADTYALSLAVSGGTVYTGGSFTSIGGASRTGLAALGVSGRATPWDPGPAGPVFALTVSGDTVYAAGLFASIGGASRRSVAALDASGVATPWNPSPDGYVRAIAVRGDTVYVGGAFKSIGEASRTCLAALDASGAATSWAPSWDTSEGPARTTSVFDMDASGRALWVGGGEEHGGGGYLLRYLGTGTKDMAIAVSPGAVRYRGVVTARGTLRTYASTLRGRTDVELWTRATGTATWRRSRFATWDATQNAYVATLPIVCNTDFQYRFPGDAEYDPAASPVASVRAQAYMSGPWTGPYWPYRGMNDYAYGLLSPYHYGRTKVYLYRKVGGTWRYWACRYATNYSYRSPSGAYFTRWRMRWVPPSRGAWKMFAVHSDSSHAYTRSPTRYFTVR